MKKWLVIFLCLSLVGATGLIALNCLNRPVFAQPEDEDPPEEEEPVQARPNPLDSTARGGQTHWWNRLFGRGSVSDDGEHGDGMANDDGEHNDGYVASQGRAGGGWLFDDGEHGDGMANDDGEHGDMAGERMHNREMSHEMRRQRLQQEPIRDLRNRR